MLLKKKTIERIKSGEITMSFRRWRMPGVKSGGTQMTQLGVVAIDAVDILSERDILEADALAGGFASKAHLIAHLSYRDDDIYRIRVHWAGEDPRIALRSNDDLTDNELNEILNKLAKMDKSSRHGTWTRKFLELIANNPATPAAKLAGQTGIETPIFKPMVRKLKTLGLTESLEVGYRLSPRGKKVLSATRDQ